jgi:hypothetical protein
MRLTVRSAIAGKYVSNMRFGDDTIEFDLAPPGVDLGGVLPEGTGIGEQAARVS